MASPLGAVALWLSPSALAQDAFEPDNSAAAAKGIVADEIQTRTIHAAGNVDWVKFVVGGTGAVDVDLETDGSDGDTEMWLIRGSTGATVAYDDDSGDGEFSRIELALLAPGTYFVKIQERNNNNILPVYTLEADWTTAYRPDAYEADDSAAAAKMIAAGQTQSRTIHSPGNADWVKFAVGGTGAERIVLETAGTVGNTEMWLYRGNGALVAYDDDSGTAEFSKIELAALTPGTYLLKVRERNNNGTIPSYTLRADWTTTRSRPDAYEADNTAAAAKSIVNGQTQIRSIHPAGNVDWVKFTVGVAGARNVVVETDGPDGNSEMWLYRGNGTLVAYDDDSGDGEFAKIAVAALARGTYLLKIQEHGNNRTIPSYTLRADWVVP